MVMSRTALAFLVALPFVSVGCSRGCSTPAAGRAAAQVPASASGSTVLAEVNGAPVTQGEVDQRAATRLAQVRQQEYEVRKQVLDEVIAERLLDAEAQKRGISREVLLKSEVEDKTASRSAGEIETIYEQNKARFGTTPKDQALARIREVLGERAKAERRLAYEKELRDRAKVAVHLDPPRASVAIPADAPSDGPASAPVSIVEFTDYQCPYCHRAQSVVDQVLAKYKGRVRFVHMDFPLEGHPGAMPAARAARCAGEQGKFWEYHRDLMTNNGSFDEVDFKARAGKLGLKADDFGSCFGSGRHDAAIRGSFRQGEELGVTGTPAYFVNGRMLSGARPFADFAELIESELAAR
jgi:protein-disulfide isomerase